MPKNALVKLEDLGNRVVLKHEESNARVELEYNLKNDDGTAYFLRFNLSEYKVAMRSEEIGELIRSNDLEGYGEIWKSEIGLGGEKIKAPSIDAGGSVRFIAFGVQDYADYFEFVVYLLTDYLLLRVSYVYKLRFKAREKVKSFREKVNVANRIIADLKDRVARAISLGMLK